MTALEMNVHNFDLVQNRGDGDRIDHENHVSVRLVNDGVLNATDTGNVHGDFDRRHALDFRGVARDGERDGHVEREEHW